jgi:hypothetical protein
MAVRNSLQESFLIPPSSDSVIELDGVDTRKSAPLPLISKRSASSRGWSCVEAVSTMVSALSGLATIASIVFSKIDSHNPNHENNARNCGIVWASSVATGALLSIRARSFKPVVLALGGPLTGLVGAAYLLFKHFTST